uniref:Uncharacterized protein n=1 Tax=Ananas comosus var. bracteatus TaxID=296719 RepID=A0A6V7QH77_ANACO|nr:unnamed protein product [Ananas comosus var. bracteatus]
MLELRPALRWHKLDYTCFISVAFRIYLILLGLVVHCAKSLPHRVRLGTAERISSRASLLARDVSIGGLTLIGFILERLKVVPVYRDHPFYALYAQAYGGSGHTPGRPTPGPGA